MKVEITSAELGDLLRGGASAFAAVLLVLLQKGSNPMSQLDDQVTALTAAVAAEGTQVDSMVVAINGFQQLLTDAVAAASAAGATPAQLQSILDAQMAIQAQTTKLATAAASVPGQPSPPPVVPVDPVDPVVPPAPPIP
jgi:hypothetical protein